MARILVIDDQTSVLIMLESVLHSRGHAVTSVTNAIDALDKLNLFPFDLIITDVVMPRVSGLQLIKTIKNDKRLAVIPIVMLSGKREKQDIERGILAGADDYIVKPIDPDIFLAKIESLITTKAPHAIKFTECHIRESFQWDVVSDIVRVSEIGITLNSSFPVEVGAKVKIQSVFLSDLELQTVQLRVVSCTKAQADVPHYIIQTYFVGLTEASLQPLRLWIRSNQIKSAG